MIYTDIDQGTDEWMQLRIGKVTASNIWKVLPGKRGAYIKERENYMCQLAIEKLTGQKMDSYVSQDMENGTELEPDARAEYELITGKVVQEVGFVDHDKIDNFGASPDGLLKESGIEIKCRKPANHISEIKDIISGKGIDYKAFLQIQACMMCVAVDKWEYILYCPIVPAWLQLYHTTIEADNSLQDDIANEINKFNKELIDYVARLEELKEKVSE
jgi:hypothetical protein